MINVAVVDYDCGNMFSIIRALEKFEVNALITYDPGVIKSADRLILPGVGSFVEGMKKLKDRGLIEPIELFVKSGKPLLGICLGMQLLLDSSEEFGYHKGLGFISGNTVLLKPMNKDKVPHVGWNSLWLPPNQSPELWRDSLLRDFIPGNDAYFVHSFIAIPKNQKEFLAVTRHGGIEFASAIKKDNITGCQFHPEKSSKSGIRMIENFLFMEQIYPKKKDANSLFVKNYNN